MDNFLSTMANWQFLNEPAYRWVIFFFGVTGFMVAWNGVLGFMH